MSMLRWIGYPLLFVLAAVAPLLVDGGDLAWVRATHVGELMAFSVFGCTLSLALLLVVSIEWRLRARNESPREHMQLVGITLLVAFALLEGVVEGSRYSGDYVCYEAAAQALEQGENPYAGTAYLYPPLLAQSLHWTAARVDEIRLLSIRHLSPDVHWNAGYRAQWVYYLYRTAMLGAALLAFLALVGFGRRSGFTATQAGGLAALMFVLSTPIIRTFRYDQVNIFVLAVSLWAVLVADRRPLVAGLLIAIGAHLKIMPLALGLPLLLAWNWRALLASGVWLAVLALAAADWGSDWTVWDQFIRFAGGFPHTEYLRDNSYHSFFFNSVLILRDGGQPDHAMSILATANQVAHVLRPLAFVAMLLRVGMRERDLRRRPEPERAGLRSWAFLGHSADMLALSLLVAPLVWSHHYIMALPFAVFVLGSCRVERRVPCGLLVAVMLLPPTFDVYPWSYHRLVALLALLVLSWPRGQTGFERWRNE